jgi:hypothetical protein
VRKKAGYWRGLDPTSSWVQCGRWHGRAHGGTPLAPCPLSSRAPPPGGTTDQIGPPLIRTSPTGNQRSMRPLSSGWASAVLAACAAAFGAEGASCGSKSSIPVPDRGPRYPCSSPTPVMIGGSDTGYDLCAGQEATVFRRRAIVQCPDLSPRATRCQQPGDSGAQCASDTECTAKPHGACMLGVDTGCHCVYGCSRDSECGAQEICLCADPIGQCYAASCNVGSCAPGYACVGSPWTPPDKCGGPFACQLSDDECLMDSDCDGGQCWVGIPPSPGPLPLGGPRVCSRNSTFTCEP